MAAYVGAVLVVDRGGEVMVFPTVDDLVTQLEAVDVRDAEYVAFDLDGRVLGLRAVGDDVQVAVTDRRDLDSVRRSVRVYGDRVGLECDPTDLVAVANELLRREWEARLPRWPRWLAVRLHGRAPKTVVGQ